MSRSVSARVAARLAAGLAPVGVRVAPVSLIAPEAQGFGGGAPARPGANRGAQDAHEVDRLRAMAEHLEAAAALAREVADSIEARLAMSAKTSPYALVTTTNETTRADHASERSEHFANHGPASDLLDARELAATLKVEVRTVRRLARTGAIPSALRIGSALRWRRAEIDAWLAGGGAH